MNYYDEIKNKIIDNEVYSKVKDYSKERHKIITYFEIGKLLTEAGGKYGDSIIEEYSKKLVVEVGKKYNRSTLFRMRQFYNLFSNKKVAPLVQQLSWSHCLILLPIKNIDEINYYISQVSKRNLSKRQLDEIVKNNEYERLPVETKEKLIYDEKLDVKDLVPNPILIKNRNNIEIFTEKALHLLILEDIESFMKELGNLFSFIGSEYKIKIGDRNYYIDLLLFNIKYNCYVVVELKVTEFKVEYISQVQKYMNFIDKNVKEPSNNSTIGILICKRENKFVIEYCSDERIVVREYELVWYNKYGYGVDKMKIILASGSKQRRDICDYIGLKYEIIKSNIEEKSNYKIPNKYVMDLSRQKGMNVKNKINDKCLIISCDTIIYMNGKKYEKPKTKVEAKNNIKEMIGKTTYAYTGVTIIDTINNKDITYYDKAALKLRKDITEKEIDWYINNEENLLERCGYTILGKGIIFIDKVVGDYNTIFGISASSLIRHLNELGYSISDLM